VASSRLVATTRSGIAARRTPWFGSPPPIRSFRLRSRPRPSPRAR